MRISTRGMDDDMSADAGEEETVTLEEIADRAEEMADEIDRPA